MSRAVHVTFVHGLANKPEPAQLRRIWLEALARPTDDDPGFDLGAAGVTDTFVYWADLFYDTPLPAVHYEARNDALAASVEGGSDPEDDAWLEAMRANYPESFEDVPPSGGDLGYERVPLPAGLKKKLMRRFLREAHDYLFDVGGVRQVIRRRVLDALESAPAGARRVLVGHSQGSFIAYDVLTGVEGVPPVDGLLTLGSPLGVDEVQDRLVWTRHDGFPARLRGDWVNVYDPLDVVSRPDPRLADDFMRAGTEAVIDVAESNHGTWRHSATKYLQGRLLRRHLRRLCGREAAR